MKSTRSKGRATSPITSSRVPARTRLCSRGGSPTMGNPESSAKNTAKGATYGTEG